MRWRALPALPLALRPHEKMGEPLENHAAGALGHVAELERAGRRVEPAQPYDASPLQYHAVGPSVRVTYRVLSLSMSMRRRILPEADFGI